MDKQTIIDENNFTSLVDECVNGSLNINKHINFEIDYYCNIVDFGFNTACVNGYCNVVKYLTHNYNVNAINGYMWACYYGQLNIVEYLIKNCNIYDDNKHGFKFACANEHINVVEYLLSKHMNKKTYNIYIAINKKYVEQFILKNEYKYLKFNNVFRILFPLCTNSNINNSIYLGVI